MATLVLGTVGTILGGPIGGAIGSLIGSQFDQAIVGSGPERIGPRLAEVSVQTSSYGTAIPQIFGTMRVAGSVIWASDLQENTAREGGGKGRPSTTTFTYSANLAVALSSRPIASVRRIWADGNLLRGAAGDFKTETLFRFYSGDEDQSIDPLIASAEGITASSAHRGISYAVFENLQLADFGNRIPSLTFEVIDHDGRANIIDIAHAVSKGAVVPMANSNIILAGYASSAATSREAIDDLISALPISIRIRDRKLELIDDSAERPVIDLIAPEVFSQNQNIADQRQFFTAPISDIPKELSLRYYDPSREYQAGLQSSSRPGTGRSNRIIDFPAALHASDAQAIVSFNQREQIFARNMLSMTLVRGDNDYSIGDNVRIAGNVHIWQIGEVEEDLGIVNVTLHASINAYSPTIIDAPGRAVNSPDLRAGQTIFTLLDLPAFGRNGLDRPNIAVAASGSEAGWRRANLFQRENDNIIPIGNVAVSATFGSIADPLQGASPHIIDRMNRPIVTLANANMMLPLGNIEDRQINNFAMIGDEIIQFQSAHILDLGGISSGDRYELRGLSRGIGGTEDYIYDHRADERFVLLDNAQLQYINNDNLTLGQSLNIEAVGLGDEVAQSEMLDNIGRSMRPLSPVHGYVQIMHNHDLLITWIRRGRSAQQWNDGVDIALDENFERYAITIMNAEQILWDEVVDDDRIIIPSANISVWREDGFRNLQIEIVQIGTYARSKPLIIEHNIL